MNEPDLYDFNDDPGTPMAVLMSADADEIADPSDDGCERPMWDE